MFTILYVDDERTLRELGKAYLERDGQFSVETVTSAPAALTLLETKAYDAIIADYQMPKMNGIEFLKRVRSLGNTIPFILFTGRGREEVVIQALNEGADFYLQKGGDPRSLFIELSHKIRLAIAHKRAKTALAESEERFRNIYNESPIAIEIYSAEGLLRDINPACCTLFGIESVDTVKGFNLFDDPNIPPDQKEQLRSGNRIRYVTVFDFNLVKKYHLYPTSCSGTIVIDVLITPVRGKTGRISEYMVQILDITDRKQQTCAMRQAGHQLA